MKRSHLFFISIGFVFLIIKNAYASDFFQIKNTFNPHVYEIILDKSSEKCPDGDLVYIHKNNNDILLLGNRVSFDLKNPKISEKVPGGCHYLTTLKYEKQKLTQTTTRTKCVHQNENATIIEKLEKTSEGFSYTNNFLKLTCFYQWSKK